MSTTITGTFSNSDKGKDIEKCHIHQAADHIPEEVTAAILLTAAAVPGTAAAEAVLLPAADAHHPHRFRDARDTFITRTTSLASYIPTMISARATRASL